MPNVEVGSDEIANMIKKFADNNPKAYFFDSFGSKLYLSLLKYVKAVVGNYLNGIIEVLSFHIPTVNIGNRQEGRLKSASVIQVSYSVDEILKGIKKALYNKEFLMEIKNINNLYGDGNMSKYVVQAIKRIIDIPKDKLLKKKLNFEIEKDEWHRYF